MKKNLLKYLLIIALFLPSFAFADVFEINKNNIVLVDLSKNNKTSRLIKKWDIKIELEWNKKINLVEYDNKLILHINWINVDESWTLKIISSNWTREIDYKINYSKPEKDLDLTNDFFVRSIQKRPLSCEISAQADILSYIKWRNINEDELLPILDKSKFNTLPEKAWDKLIWWNPNDWFVWYIENFKSSEWYTVKPTQRLMTWYWVYEKPIQGIYTKYWVKSVIVNKSNHSSKLTPKKHLEALLEALNKWYLVQLWWDWCTDSRFDSWSKQWNVSQADADNWIYWKNTCSRLNEDRTLNWYYYDKNWKLVKHEWLSWEHNFYLLWYKWTIKNPTKLIIWDTNTWRHEYPVSEWMRKWKLMDYRSLIIENN